jgi:Ca2+:H+ antiporter
MGCFSFLTSKSIALVKNHIRIVQASLAGSILVNLLLILGMCFLLGGLRFREQIYNSTVTQMSASLLALSVTSLLLPTAFHASFSNEATADDKVLQVSRGTSIIVLVVYFLYLVFQLKSHSYIYASTPRDVIERAAVPGPAAYYFHPSNPAISSSASESRSNISTRSESSAQTFRRMVREGKRVQRSEPSDRDTAVDSEMVPSIPVSSRFAAAGLTDLDLAAMPVPANPIDENEKARSIYCPEPKKQQSRWKRRYHRYYRVQKTRSGGVRKTSKPSPKRLEHEAQRSNFAAASALEAQQSPSQAQQRPLPLFALHPSLAPTGPRTRDPSPATPGQPLHPEISRSRSEPTKHRHNQHRRTHDPTMPPMIPPSTYTTTATTTTTPPPPHRSVSPHHHTQPTQTQPSTPSTSSSPSTSTPSTYPPHKPNPPSRTTATLLLLLTTALVALHASLMITSITPLLATSPGGLSEAFIGLILLPLVGNAAEHGTAVTVALQNKVDLAIGVAVGSSIQIALFVTPLVVLLGWALDREMSLFFTIFETVCVFVSAFIVNFLVLDGKSNYLEGALLCAGYVIVAVAAFFYPDARAANELGRGG